MLAGAAIFRIASDLKVGFLADFLGICRPLFGGTRALGGVVGFIDIATAWLGCGVTNEIIIIFD